MRVCVRECMPMHRRPGPQASPGRGQRRAVKNEVCLGTQQHRLSLRERHEARESRQEALAFPRRTRLEERTE